MQSMDHKHAAQACGTGMRRLVATVSGPCDQLPMCSSRYVATVVKETVDLHVHEGGEADHRDEHLHECDDVWRGGLQDEDQPAQCS